ncbi:hypothetical protein M8J76_000660 [Diaphorina citri]|nr:hypothetical protein M8J76_000660 [Diaphorina citri]
MSQTFSSVVQVNLPGGTNLRPSFNPAKRSTNEKRPSKDQAITLSSPQPDHVLNTPYYMFIRAVGNVLGPHNIVAASKIPGSKFCIFLSSQELAKKFQTENPTLEVNNIQFNVSLYSQPAAKLVLCNTWPFLPNHVFEEALDRHIDRNILFISPIKDMTMGFLDKEYSKINFFKRYLFIQSADSQEIKIPDHMFVTHEGMSYKIFLEIENKCKICQEPHPTNKCPTKVPTDKPNLNERLEQARMTRMQVDQETSQISPISPLNKDITEIPSKQEIIPPTLTLELNQENEKETQNVNDSSDIDTSSTQDDVNVDQVPSDNFRTPSTPKNENNKRVITPSPSHTQPQPKKSKDESKEILKITTQILKDRTDIMIEPQDFTRLWIELKNSKKQKEILYNHNYKNDELLPIFQAISNYPDLAKNMRARSKKIESMLIDEVTDISDTSSISSQL